MSVSPSPKSPKIGSSTAALDLAGLAHHAGADRGQQRAEVVLVAGGHAAGVGRPADVEPERGRTWAQDHAAREMGLGQQLALEADLEPQAHEQAGAVLEPAGELVGPELATHDPTRGSSDDRLGVELKPVDDQLVGARPNSTPRSLTPIPTGDRGEHVLAGDPGEHQRGFSLVYRRGHPDAVTCPCRTR